jgi:hypothetical protein
VAIAHSGTDKSGDIASATATVTITKPTGFNTTDVLISVFGSDSLTGTAANVVTAPSGWTAVSAGFSKADAGNDFVSLYAFWALGSVANLGFTNSVTGANVSQGWVCVGFSGVDNTTPIDATSGVNDSNTGSSTLTTSAVTVATANAWHLIAFADWLGKAFTATGFTVAENAHSNASAALLYNTTPKSAGSTGTVSVSSVTASGQINTGLAFALRPAGAGAAFLAPRPVILGQAVQRAAYW